MADAWNKQDWLLSGDQSYADYLLDARNRFLEHNAATVKQIRDIYTRAANDIARDIRDVTPGTLRYNHLSSMQKILEDRAKTINEKTLDAIYDGIKLSVKDGTEGAQRITQDLLKYDKAGVQWMFADINERAVLAITSRTGKDGLKLSDRVWRIGENVRKNMATVVEDAVARGLDSRTLAKRVQQYMQPGKWTAMKRETRRMLGVSSDVSYEAMRLARTEMSNAYHEGTILANQSAPSYLGIIWMLSGRHPLPDVCNDYASHNGDGFWPAGSEPTLPHPQCLCIALPRHEKPSEFAERLRSWARNPNSDMKLEKWYNEVGSKYITRPILPKPGPTGAAKGSSKPVSKEPLNKVPLASIDDLNTLPEIEQYLMAKHPNVKVSFETGNVDTIKRAAKQFDELCDKYPDAAETLVEFTDKMVKEDQREGLLAYTRAFDLRSGKLKQDIVLNPMYFSQPPYIIDNMVSESIKTGWFSVSSKGGIEKMITHEFGHVIDRYLATNQLAFAEAIMADGFGKINDTWFLWKYEKLEKINNPELVGKYGITYYRQNHDDPAEKWAEIFTASEDPNNAGKPEIQNVNTVLDILLDKKRYTAVKSAEENKEILYHTDAWDDIQQLKKRMGL